MKNSIVFLLVFLGALCCRAETERVIELRDLPLLFADDSGVAASSGVIRTIHPARTRSTPVLGAQLPWEGSRVYLYGSVIFDEAAKRFSMWYLGHPDGLERGSPPAVPGFRNGKGDLTLYATSLDGLHWDKPALGLHAFQESTANNIVFDLHSPSVLLDQREKDPAKRYKMLGTTGGSYHAAISADGLTWNRYPKDQPVLKFSDNISLTQDPASGDYLAYHRRPTESGRSTVSLARSHDFKKWSAPELVFEADAEDDAWVTHPDEGTEVYNLSVFPHAAGFVGLPTMFRGLGKNPAKKLPPGQSPRDGIVEVQLITSEDGREWHRTHPRISVIERGAPGSFDAGTILGVSSTCVHAGDETWVYYTALTTSHGAPIPPKRSAIGRAEWRRHGFVSLDSGERGHVETKPLKLTAPSLIINANAVGGELRVALLEADGRPIAGFALEDSEVLITDATRWRAKWYSAADVPMDRPLRIVLAMKQCRLYSLSVP
ncbi:MAG: hypothetical protein JWO94_3640 [Verrucomicrobiaceae bacterium]|nr:hypothetical protein [Verrucomicrobiaceae bacterium]